MVGGGGTFPVPLGLILLQINRLYTNAPEKQVVVCCDNFSPPAEIACEYFFFKIQQVPRDQYKKIQYYAN